MNLVEVPPGEQFRNRILNALPAAEVALLRPLLSPVRLVNGQGLHESGEPIEHVYFVEHGFASVVAEVGDTSGSVEVGLIGRDSMTGLTAVFSADAITYGRVMVQMPGAGYRMSAQALRDNLEAMPTLRMLLPRALEGMIAQVSQTAACNSRHTLPERLARWLLMARDRADSDELALTQEFLSMMLTVRRSGVTVAMGTLAAAGLVGHRRGRVLITDRPGLEAAACDCYRRVQAFAAGVAARPGAPDRRVTKLHAS